MISGFIWIVLQNKIARIKLLVKIENGKKHRTKKRNRMLRKKEKKRHGSTGCKLYLIISLILLEGFGTCTFAHCP